VCDVPVVRWTEDWRTGVINREPARAAFCSACGRERHVIEVVFVSDWMTN